MQPLDHNTVNRFRTQRIRSVYEDIFLEIVIVLVQAGYITLDTYFLDGTKIEAYANKFSFVWKKSTDKYQTALRTKVYAHLLAIDEINDEEDALALSEPDEIDAHAIEKAAQKINERLAKKRKRFTRFTLRELEKATLEFRLIAAGHNIRKLFYAKSIKMLKIDAMG